jgi:hypothetical protein
VAIDWNDNKKRQAFRQALQEVYPKPGDLEMFVDEELNENLAVVAGGDNLQLTAFELVQWAKAKGRLDKIYEVFKEAVKRENPKHPIIGKLKQHLEQQSFVPQTSNLPQADWDKLFGQFLPNDLADLKRAFERGFNEALGFTFQQAQPNYPPLIEITQIRELLEIYDVSDKGLVLAVRFVEFAIAELQRSSEGNHRNLTSLKQWRDRISQQHNIPPKPSEPVTPTACHAYLLVALEEIGSDVNVYPELHITGVEKPIRFGAKPITCSVSQVADQISQWINQAEETLEIRQCEEEEVTLELFLPCKHLEEDIAMTWNVKDKRGSEVLLGNYRRFLVRSSERIRDRKIQKALAQKWKWLEGCVKAGDGCSQFHLQEACLEQKGTLSALLKDRNATGLKLVAKLPSDLGKRLDLLNDIIDAAIPIAVWSSEMAETDTDTLKTEFDRLLKQCHLTNFADLAKQ